MTPDHIYQLLAERRLRGERLAAHQVAFLEATDAERAAYLDMADPHATRADGSADNRETRVVDIWRLTDDGGGNYAATRDDQLA